MPVIGIIDEELHKKFRIYCIKHEVSARKIFEDHMRKLVEEDEAKPQNAQ